MTDGRNGHVGRQGVSIDQRASERARERECVCVCARACVCAACVRESERKREGEKRLYQEVNWTAYVQQGFGLGKRLSRAFAQVRILKSALPLLCIGSALRH